MDTILSEITEKLKFGFATISLVDEYRGCVETVRGRNISPGWIMRAKHALNVRDIQTYVVSTGETKIIEGPDDLLDKVIYERFEHWRLVRIWTPILAADQKVVGTIEAGCNIGRRSEVFTDSAIERVKELGREKGEEIATRRPHILLQRIAGDAIRLIGADSATLHVYRRNPSESSEAGPFEWGDPILAAGAGRATPSFVQNYRPSQSGRGRIAVQTGKPVQLDDSSQFEVSYPELYKMGVRALAVVPIKLGPDAEGVLGIHFWRDGKGFSQREINLAEMFAREMAAVIKNYLLLRRVMEVAGKAWALSGLRNLTQSLASPFVLPDVLKNIARNALLTSDADNVSVYQYHEHNKTFYLPPVVDGLLLDPVSIKGTLAQDEMLASLVSAGTHYYVNAHEPSILSAPRTDGASRFIDREKIKSCAVLVMRPSVDGEVAGLLFVNFRQVHSFTSEEKATMEGLATSAALAIINARLHKDDLNKQLQTMHKLLAAIAEKGADLKQVFECFLQQTLVLTGAQHAVCMRYNEQTEILESIARWPIPERYTKESLMLDQGIIGLAARSKKSILVEDVKDTKKSMFIETIGEFFPEQIYRNINTDTRSEIAVPLLDAGRLLGVLNIESVNSSREGGLTNDHRVFLQTLAVPAIIAFHTVDLYQRQDRRNKHLGALNLVTEHVQPHGIDTIVRLFLTAITAGAGLGFSRAMLLLPDRDNGKLIGEAAVGPLTRQEADRVWQKFEQGELSSTRDLRSLLRNAERRSDEIKVADSPLDAAIRQLRIPLDNSAGAPARCFLKGTSQRVEYKQLDPFREVLRKLTDPNDEPHAFVCVPLVGKHTKRIGVLVADKRFLWGEREIDGEEIDDLEGFVRVLALTIENTRLRERMAEEQAAGMSHTIGHQLGLIGAMVERLNGYLLSSNEPQLVSGMLPLLNKARHHSIEANTVLADFRIYAGALELKRKITDLNDIVKDLSADIAHLWPCETDLWTQPLPINADASKLTSALTEIIKNAHQEMAGQIGAVARLKVCAETSGDGTGYARVEIADTGRGIEDRFRDRIFEPFVTSKREKGGTGLGLSNARKIIEKHSGTVEARNNAGGGACFVIRLPIFAG